MKMIFIYICMLILNYSAFAEDNYLTYYLTSFNVSTKVDQTTNENLKGYFRNRTVRHFEVKVHDIEAKENILTAKVWIKQLAIMKTNGLSLVDEDKDIYHYEIIIQNNETTLNAIQNDVETKPFTREVLAVSKMLDVNYGIPDLEFRYFHFGLETIKRSSENFTAFYCDRIEKLISGEYMEFIESRNGFNYKFEYFLTVQPDSLGRFVERWMEQQQEKGSENANENR